MIQVRDFYYYFLLGGAIYFGGQNSLPAILRSLAPTNGVVAIAPGGLEVVNREGLNPSIGLYTNWPNICEVTTVPDAEGLIFTGVGTDLAIRGLGCFVVRVPDQDLVLYTRAGDFRLDSNGYLITSQGYRVQGYNSPSAREIGNIQIDGSFVPAATGTEARMTTFDVQANGDIRVWMSDGTKYIRAQILLQKFGAPDELERVEYHLFASTPAAFPASSLATPGSGGLGLIESSALDLTPLQPQLKCLAATDESNPFRRGAVTRTGRVTDLAIRGAGAFLIRDPATSELFATRAGAFLVDRDGYLITYDRKRVQGRLDAVAGRVGDIQVGANTPATTDATAVQTYIYFDPSGRVNVRMSDGTQIDAGQILLYGFGHSRVLSRTNLGQFSGVAAAQPYVIEQVGRYGGSFSRIEQGQLELINATRDLLMRRERLSFFPQGSLYRTGVPSHLALDGAGFFQLRNPATGERFVTRRGDFRVDSAGYLVSAKGLRVQGYSDSLRVNVGDLQIDDQGLPRTTAPGAILAKYAISKDGALNVHMSDGTEFLRGQVLLQTFRETFLLRPIRDDLYENLASAGPVDLAEPGAFGLGQLQSSTLENPVEHERLTLPARDGFRLAIIGEPGSRWTIQASENFAVWKTIGMITNAGFESEFCDREVNCHPRRFYRVLATYPAVRQWTYLEPHLMPMDLMSTGQGISRYAAELLGRNHHRLRHQTAALIPADSISE